MKLLFFALTFLTLETAVVQKPKEIKPGKQLNGSWVLITVKGVAADSTITYPYGENPAGNMTLAGDGNYSIQIYRSGRSKIASGNKNTATPEENSILVKGCNAHYGTYTIDLKNSLLIFSPEHAFFPNWEGQELKQNFVLQGDTLTYSSGVSTFGASKSIVIWKKK